MKLSDLSETLIGSEIVKLGGDIREKISKGEKIYNFTVGDFDPQTKQLVEEPAVFLDYYAVVSDEDLKRIANRPNVRAGIHFRFSENQREPGLFTSRDPGSQRRQAIDLFAVQGYC